MIGGGYYVYIIVHRKLQQLLLIIGHTTRLTKYHCTLFEITNIAYLRPPLVVQLSQVEPVKSPLYCATAWTSSPCTHPYCLSCRALISMGAHAPMVKTPPTSKTCCSLQLHHLFVSFHVQESNGTYFATRAPIDNRHFKILNNILNHLTHMMILDWKLAWDEGILKV
jgi:hypothetical protein